MALFAQVRSLSQGLMLGREAAAGTLSGRIGPSDVAFTMSGDYPSEGANGRVIVIEVKSATITNQADAKGLRFLSGRLGDRLQAGLLLHTGPLTARLPERIWATPASALWGSTAPADMPVPVDDADRL